MKRLHLKSSLTSALALSLALASSPALAAGKTVTVAYPSDFQSLDPAIGYDTQNWPVIHALFVTLLTYDAGTKLKPWGATDLGTVSPDFTRSSGESESAVRASISENCEASVAVASLSARLI